MTDCWENSICRNFDKFREIFHYAVYIGGTNARSCTCGNTETLSNKMENFKVHLIKFSPDSETGRISIVCNICGHESEEVLIGN
jgi:hypothetical protein